MEYELRGKLDDFKDHGNRFEVWIQGKRLSKFGAAPKGLDKGVDVVIKAYDKEKDGITWHNIKTIDSITQQSLKALSDDKSQVTEAVAGDYQIKLDAIKLAIKFCGQTSDKVSVGYMLETARTIKNEWLSV